MSEKQKTARKQRVKPENRTRLSLSSLTLEDALRAAMETGRVPNELKRASKGSKRARKKAGYEKDH